MQAPKESSVLFALDELRDIEDIRKRDQREVARLQAKENARLQAKESARVAQEELRKREEAEREASEIVRLQVQHEDDARSRRILEAQLAADAQANASLQSRLRLLEADAGLPSRSLAQQNVSNRIHAYWAMAMVATLGAFMLLIGQREQAATAVAEAGPTHTALVPTLPAAAADCPEPAASASAAPSTPAMDAAPASEAKEKVRPHHGGKGTGKHRPKPPTARPIDISACGDDPLGCMPE